MFNREMAAKRLTKAEKFDILEGYRAGRTSQDLSKEYKCSVNTINRTVKTLTTEEEYQEMKGKRAKDVSLTLDKKTGTKFDSRASNDSFEEAGFNFHDDIRDVVNETDKSLVINLEKEDDEDSSEKYKNQFSKEINDSSNENFSEFQVITPLSTEFGFEKEKQKVACKALDDETLPDIVYMLIDKKVEVEPQLISELSDWDFLPKSEQERKAILLFSNQRTAKRSCARTQRVIKIPNTNVFKLSSNYLVAKGITRLILEDCLISIDS